MNLAYGQGGLKSEINIPLQHISAKSKGGLIIEGGVSSSEYGTIIRESVGVHALLLIFFPLPILSCSSGWFPVQYVEKIWPTPEP